MEDKGLYTGLAVADYFIEKAVADGKLISNMSVLKMIFFAQGLGYDHIQRRLISDPFYAWKLGPVEQHTYYEFKRYGWQSITKPSGKCVQEVKNLSEDKEVSAFLDALYNSLINRDPFALSAITHEKGTPWDKTEQSEVIDENVIRSFYSKS